MTRLGIENLAKEVLKAVGVAPAPPIPVRLVAERLGVSDISTRPMLEEGALVRLGTVTKVLLREGRSPSRQRSPVYPIGGTLPKCDPFGTPSTSHWTGAAIIVRSPRTKTCIVTRSRTSTRPMPFSLAG